MINVQFCFYCDKIIIYSVQKLYILYQLHPITIMLLHQYRTYTFCKTEVFGNSLKEEQIQCRSFFFDFFFSKGKRSNKSNRYDLATYKNINGLLTIFVLSSGVTYPVKPGQFDSMTSVRPEIIFFSQRYFDKSNSCKKKGLHVYKKVYLQYIFYWVVLGFPQEIIYFSY